MPDDPRLRGKPDQDRVSEQQWEVDLLVQKFGLTEATVRAAIRSHGPMRVNVEAELRRIKSGLGR